MRPHSPPLLARTAAALLIGSLLALSTQADERHDRDHDRARAALQAGEVMPLHKLLDGIQRTHPGEVLEVELEREGGRWVYEIKLLQAGGALVRLEADARTGQVLKRRERPSPEPKVAPETAHRRRP